mgnify:CR=1 FL=1
MLKPKRKITKQEIKRDPFLETVDRLENSFEKNKKTFLNIVLGILVGVFIVNFLFEQTQIMKMVGKWWEKYIFVVGIFLKFMVFIILS